MFTQDAGSGKSLVDLMSLDLIVGSGGVLSHAPRREQSALMMMDAYQPEGITHLAVDSIFMMPQLGILSTVLPEAASQVFERDCLIRLGTCVAPTGSIKEGETAVTFEFDGRTETVPFGAIEVLSMTADDIREIEFKPARGLDLGAGKGKPVKASVQGGVAGLIIDTRGRPLNLPSENAKRIAKLNEWLKAFNLPTAE
jgi:hypothetical protein